MRGACGNEAGARGGACEYADSRGQSGQLLPCPREARSGEEGGVAGGRGGRGGGGGNGGEASDVCVHATRKRAAEGSRACDDASEPEWRKSRKTLVFVTVGKH